MKNLQQEAHMLTTCEYYVLIINNHIQKYLHFCRTSRDPNLILCPFPI